MLRFVKNVGPFCDIKAFSVLYSMVQHITSLLMIVFRPIYIAGVTFPLLCSLSKMAKYHTPLEKQNHLQISQD